MGFNSLNIQGAIRKAPEPRQGLASVQDMLDGFFALRQRSLEAELQAQVQREQMAQAAANAELNFRAAQGAQETARQRLAYDAIKDQQTREDELRKNVTTAAASKEVQDALAAGNIDEANARVQPWGTRFERKDFTPEELPEVAPAPEKPRAMQGQDVADTLSAVSSGLIPRMSIPVDESERAGYEEASAANRAQLAAREAVEGRNRAGAAEYEARPRYRLAPVVADGIPGLDLGGEFVGGARRTAGNQILDQKLAGLRALPGGDVIAKRVEAAYRDSALPPAELAKEIDKVVADERDLAMRAKKKGGSGGPKEKEPKSELVVKLPDGQTIEAPDLVTTRAARAHIAASIKVRQLTDYLSTTPEPIAGTKERREYDLKRRELVVATAILNNNEGKPSDSDIREANEQVPGTLTPHRMAGYKAMGERVTEKLMANAVSVWGPEGGAKVVESFERYMQKPGGKPSGTGSLPAGLPPGSRPGPNGTFYVPKGDGTYDQVRIKGAK